MSPYVYPIDHLNVFIFLLMRKLDLQASQHSICDGKTLQADILQEDRYQL